MNKIGAFSIVMLALSQSAIAQLVVTPSSGTQLQQIPPAPVPQRSIPDIRVEPRSTPGMTAQDQIRIPVKTLRVTGQTLYSEADLVGVAGFSGAGEVTLGQLRGMASKIADHYRRNGYFVAQAYLAAQDIKDGVVTISVIEGRYGSVNLRNQTNISDGLPNGLLQGLNSGDPVAIEPLENRLLLLSDIPGVIVRSTLLPGAAVGTSDLNVDLTAAKRVSGSVEADNAGNRYTGYYRLGATVNISNLAGHGDVLSFRGLTSGKGLNYGRVSYQMQFGKATVGVAYTALAYELGREFASLKAHGTAEIASVYGSYPLIRSRNTNVYALVGFDAKTYKDEEDVTFTVTDKKAQVFMASINGNRRDNLGGGGLSSGSLTWNTGEIDIITPAALARDQATFRTNGHFDKLGFFVSRLQNITPSVSLYGSFRGQVASKNLDISEKFGLGGMYGVRSYPVGEAYADEGYLATLEARLLLPKSSDAIPGRFHLIGFVDTGSVTINHSPIAAGTNKRTLSGIGIGLTWADYNNFVVNTYYAQKLGNEPTLSEPDAKGRFWIQGVKYF